MDLIKNSFSSEILDCFLHANIVSISEIFKYSKKELIEKTNLKSNIIDQVISVTSRLYCSDKLQTANKIRKWQRISTGCESIDNVINGGIPVNGITEIVGCSGVGKTQFCLQLAIITQLPVGLGGLEKDVVYICTEDVFPSKRLRELARLTQMKYNVNNNFQDNILISHISNYEQLSTCVGNQLEKLLTFRKIGLVVIDSIAGVFRGDSNELSYTNRAEVLTFIVSKLIKLSTIHNFAVVCVNQMSDNVETGETQPALGLTWSNFVTCRFLLNRSIQSGVREFEIIFAPDLPNLKCQFQIRENGLIKV